MNPKNQLVCAWSGPVAMVVFTIGFWLMARYLPPTPPDTSAADLATLYQNNASGIRLGVLLTMFAASLTAPWVAVIAVQMKRIEGSAAPVYAYTQLGTGMLGVLVIVIPCLLWTAAAFRLDRDPQLILLLNDVAWLMFTMMVGPAVIQQFAIGLAILSDRRATPIFPRWAGYMNIWVGIGYLPATPIGFFKNGPFAWNGLLGFWVPIAAYGIWFVLMFLMLTKAIRQQAAELA